MVKLVGPKAPLALVVVVVMGTPAPSQERVTVELAGNPVPETVSVDPTVTPDVVPSVIAGVVVVAIVVVVACHELKKYVRLQVYAIDGESPVTVQPLAGSLPAQVPLTVPEGEV
jgi:hypothetical protein